MQYIQKIRTEYDIRKFADQIGGELVSAEKTKHWKIVIRLDGVMVKTTVAISPSDHRTRLFEATRIKRMARGHYEECGWMSLVA